MQEKIREWWKLDAKDIHLMRKLKPWSNNLTYWWLLQFMFRKELISLPKVTERQRYIFISIDGENMWSCGKQKLNHKWKSIKEIEIAAKIVINNLLKQTKIQDYFVRKLKKQIWLNED
jgi:hypothetical protein